MVFLFKSLIPVENAQRIILENVNTIKETEIVDIDEASWRVLAENIFAPIDLPSFDRATQDGYAVKYVDILGATEKEPRKLKIIGYSKTGYFPEKELSTGETYRIDTGAPLPKGADTVVPIEYTTEEDGCVYIYKMVPYRANIQGAGGDISKGELVLSKRMLLTPRHIGALAGLGISKIRVIRKPIVAVFSIGDELVPLGQSLKKGKIYDINIHTISALVKQNYAEVADLGIAEDNADSILEKLSEGLEKADLVISTGGSSVGQSDFVRHAANALQARMLFHGVMSKPGKPVFAATINNKLYLGLPGNPTSAIISFMLYAQPAIRKLLGIKAKSRSSQKIRLGKREYGVKGRRLYKTIIVKEIDGKLLYESLPPASESISTLFRADAYFVVPENVDFFDENDEVEIRFFEDIEQTADIIVVGVFAPRLLRKIIRALDVFVVKYIKRNSESAVLAFRGGFADIAIVRGNIRSELEYTRKLVRVGKPGRLTFTVYNNFEDAVHVNTHQSAILGVINGLADNAIVPIDIAELYNVDILEEVGSERLSILASDRVRRYLSNIV